MATIDSLPFIDMSTLTQSELRSLSLSSTSAFDLNRLDDVVIPVIDRSLFNESAGSRKQTFSRPTTTTHTQHHHHLRHRIAGLLPSSKQPPSSSLPPHLDPEHLENRSILNSLRQSLSQSPQFDDVVSLFSVNSVQNEHEQVLRKRKRGRKPKTKVKSLEENLEIVNKDGMVVDIVGLGNLEDPFGEELRRRTEGLGGSEEELLGFMRDLGGQWCSRRKKRKIVDANVLGNILPIGWKLLLGLKRREGRASVYCRRYISPGGQHFLSCKEVSGYLQSYFGLHEAQLLLDHGGDSIQQDYKVGLESQHAGAAQKENEQMHSNEREKEVTLLGIDNLAEVQVRDLFECHKCDMTFDEKDTYLQHLLSFHQRTTRRYRLGSSVGDGVIIKDGKFECQFCHKVFHERRRYNGHVGIHVRNYVRGIEETPGQLNLQKRTESPARDELPTRISKMDALIEIAQNSILETSSIRPNDKPSGGSSTDKQNAASISELPASISDGLDSDSASSEPEMDDGMVDANLDKESYQQNNKHKITDEKMKMIDDAGNIMDVRVDIVTTFTADERNSNSPENFDEKGGLAFIADEIDKSLNEEERGSACHLLASSINQKVEPFNSSVNLGCTNKVEVDEPKKVNNNNDIELQNGFVRNNGTYESSTSKDNLLQHGVSESSISLVQPSDGPSTSNVILNKGEDGPCRVDQGHDNVTGFEELRLDEIEHLKFNFGAGQESLSLAEVPIQIASNAGMGGSFGPSVQFESEVLLNMPGRHALTTVCVWCGMEFNHDAADSEIQSDSVGYMCPTCKAKISGQLSVLGSG